MPVTRIHIAKSRMAGPRTAVNPADAYKSSSKMESRLNTWDPRAYNTKRRSYELPTVWNLCCRGWPLRRIAHPSDSARHSNQKTGQAETPARFFDSVSLVVRQGFRRKHRAIPSAPRAAPSNITVAPLSGTGGTPDGGTGWRSALT